MTGRPSLAVIGAGPVDVEAAIAGIDYGYQVAVYEEAPTAAANVREWAHVQLFTPWDMSLSPRAWRGLPDLPAGETCPSGAELAELIDVLAASLPPGVLRLDTRVDAIGRDGLVKSDEIGTGRSSFSAAKPVGATTPSCCVPVGHRSTNFLPRSTTR